MTKIKGHTVGSDGIVYNPDTASFGYISSMDNRVTNNSSDERGTLVTDQGRHVAISQPAVAAVQTSVGGGGSGAGSGGAAVSENPVSAPGGSGPGSRLVVTTPGKGVPGFSPGVIEWWQQPTAFTDAPDVDGIENKPLKRIGIGGPQEAMGGISDVGWVRTNMGWTSVPSSDVKERIEDDIFQEGSWNIRNKVLPDLGLVPQPYPSFLGPISANRYDFWSSEWQIGGVGQGGAGGGGF